MIKKRGFKIAVAVVLCVTILVGIFFSIWGISRAQTKKLSGMAIQGTWTAYNWSQSDEFKIEDYYSINISENEAVKILFLTDIHYRNDGWYADYIWGGNSQNTKTDKQIKDMFNATQPSFIIVTGDLETGTLNDLNYKRFTDFMDTLKTPWTVTFGNHDAEHRADKAALMNIMQASEYCKFQQGATNLQGLGNTIINIKNGDAILYSMFMLDTGDWQNAPGALSSKNRGEHIFSTVDVGITDMQIAWYKWAMAGIISANNNIVPASLIACHIPMQGYDYAVELGEYAFGSKPFEAESFRSYTTSYDILYQSDKTINRHTAQAYNEYKRNDKLFTALEQFGSTRTFVTGHNHCAGYQVDYDSYSYLSVPKTGDIYTDLAWDNGTRGALVMNVAANGATSFAPIYYRENTKLIDSKDMKFTFK